MAFRAAPHLTPWCCTKATVRRSSQSEKSFSFWRVLVFDKSIAPRYFRTRPMTPTPWRRRAETPMAEIAANLCTSDRNCLLFIPPSSNVSVSVAALLVVGMIEIRYGGGGDRDDQSVFGVSKRQKPQSFSIS